MISKSVGCGVCHPETDGKLNVIPKSQKRPVTPEDLKIQTPYEDSYTLIMDGIFITRT